MIQPGVGCWSLSLIEAIPSLFTPVSFSINADGWKSFLYLLGLSCSRFVIKSPMNTYKIY